MQRNCSHFDPYRETSQRVLMRLLALGGLPAQALAQYTASSQLLMDEFGAEPDGGDSDSGRADSARGTARCQDFNGLA